MATLTVTVQESVTIEGKLYGNTVAKEFTSIEQVYQQVVNVGTSIQELIGFDPTEKAGNIADDKMKYMRITNRDATNFVTISFDLANASASVSDVAGFKLNPGCSFLLNDDDLGVATAGAGVSLSQLDAIYGLADTAACKVEIMIGATA